MMVPLREPGQPCGYPFATKAFSISFVKEQLPEQRTTNIRMASPMSRGLSNYFQKICELIASPPFLRNYGQIGEEMGEEFAL